MAGVGPESRGAIFGFTRVRLSPIDCRTGWIWYNDERGSTGVIGLNPDGTLFKIELSDEEKEHESQ